jgi:hypothetical protein
MFDLRLMPAVIVLVLILHGCADAIPVRVSSFRDPARNLSLDTPLCFLPPDVALGPSPALDTSRLYSVMVTECDRAAREVGAQVVAYGDACDPIKMSIHVSAGHAEAGGGWTPCVRTGPGFALCADSGDAGTVYGKSLELTVADRGRSTQPIGQVTAVVTSSSPAFMRATATVLCRAAFRAYPRELLGETLYVEPEW